MPAIAYTVIATLPDEQTRSEYIAWLESAHVNDVVKAGAHTAMILRIEDPVAPLQVEARYIFTTRQDFDRYLRDSAPALRADGLKRFPPNRGIRLERRIGVVV
jgi:Domain of unknown function (DUF4286)